MTVLFAGTSISDFDYVVNAAATTNTANFDNNFVSEAVNLIAADGCWVQCSFTSTSEIWVGWKVVQGATGVNTQNRYDIIFYATSGQILFYWNQNNSGAGSNSSSFGGDIYMVTPGGTTTLAANIYNLTPTTKHHWDINIKIHATDGFVRFYQNGGLIYDSGLIDTEHYAGTGATINRVRFGHAQNTSSMGNYISEVIITDVDDTRNARLQELRLSANGTHTAWTNDITAVDETGINDGDYILADTAGLTETYTLTDIYSGVASYDVLAVVVTMRVRRGAAGPQNLRSVVRTNSLDFESADIPSLEQAFKGRSSIWSLNPDTGAVWTQAEVNALEAGVKSIGSWLVSSQVTPNTNSGGWGNHTIRLKIAAAALSNIGGSKVRVTFNAPTNQADFQIVSAYIGHKAATGDVYDFETTPVQLFFEGNPGKTFAQSEIAVTDEATFSIGSGKDVIVSFNFSSVSIRICSAGGATNWNTYYKVGADASTVDATGYTFYLTDGALGAFKIESYK